jgi:hypothetical protein
LNRLANSPFQELEDLVVEVVLKGEEGCPGADDVTALPKGGKVRAEFTIEFLEVVHRLHVLPTRGRGVVVSLECWPAASIHSLLRRTCFENQFDTWRRTSWRGWTRYGIRSGCRK